MVEKYVPLSRHKPKRRLFLAGQAIMDVNDPNSAVNVLVGKGPMAAAMTRWTLGESVWGNKKRGLFLDSLDPPPDDVWEIRVTAPRPQVRILGCFADPDTLVLFCMHSRSYLGKKGSAAWIAAMGTCSTNWATLFPNDPPFRGKTIHDYVTENCDDFPVKF